MTAAPRVQVLSTLEYVLRLAFFAAVPFVLVVATILLPMTGAIVTMAIALVGFFFAELMLRLSEKRPWLKGVLDQPIAFEAHYREHPPGPFLYYVFYPLLFPYWLRNARARRELLLYRGYTLITLTILVSVGAFRFFTIYQPEIGIAKFLYVFVATLVIESLAVFMFVMPMTTSVVALHQRGQRKRLWLMLAVGLASAAAAGELVYQRRHAFPSYETRRRIVWRTQADPARALVAREKAMRIAWNARRAKGEAWGREEDGNVVGEPIDQAREVLASFYRDDEAAAFELWTTGRRDKNQLMVLYADTPRASTIFFAMRPDGTRVERLADIPKPARKVMRTAGDY